MSLGLLAAILCGLPVSGSNTLAQASTPLLAIESATTLPVLSAPPNRWAVRLGYGIGNSFDKPGGRGSLEGFEIGADYLIREIPKVGSLSLSPTITFGGAHRHGSDTDGTIYRVLLTLRHETRVVRNLYAGFGLGYSRTDSRGTQFSNVDGLATEYLLGYTIPTATGTRYRPFVELGYHDGVSNKLRGWSFQVGMRF